MDTLIKSRKAHLKSRNGCSNCKKRHVKCDEQGPPCANCVSRQTTSTCTYKPTSKPGSRQSPDASSSTSLDLVEKPSFLGAPAECSSLLQLELMHRWSTTTYKSIVAVAPDGPYMQFALPQRGLKYNFLLNGMFALAALEIAASGHPEADKYSRRAMAFYDRSSSSFRKQLTNLSTENLEVVFIYSGIVSLLNAAMGMMTGRSAIEASMTMFELSIGTAILAYKHNDLLKNSSYGASIHAANDAFASDLPEVGLDTEAAFLRLHALVDFLETLPEEPAPKALRVFHSRPAMYREGVRQMYRLFLEDEKGIVVGMCLAYPALMGPDIIAAIRDEDPMALILLMFWGLLINRLANVAWWAVNLGVRLVEEAEAILLASGSDLLFLPECGASIDWVKSQLGRRMFIETDACAGCKVELVERPMPESQTRRVMEILS